MSQGKQCILELNIAYYLVEEGKISYFGLARNLIRHLISRNQNDLSNSTRIFHFRLEIG